MSEPVIVARNLTRCFGQFKAVDNINLTVQKGEIFGFLGPNGCGKSTTIRMLTGLLTPTVGTINILGLEIPKETDALRLKIGYMTQKFSLYDDLTLQENLEFMGQIFGMSSHKLKERINEQAELFDLTSILKQRAGSLSGGQKQRLSLASATMHTPDLLFLDEPTSAVDPENRREFWEQLFDLSDRGITILVTTHYMDEAERCHNLAIMEAGVIRANGTPQNLMNEMGVHVIEIEGSDLRTLKQKLLSYNEIHTIAQIGTRLRVLITQKIISPIEWLQEQEPGLTERKLTLARPSLEDVFVTCTGEGRQ